MIADSHIPANQRVAVRPHGELSQMGTRPVTWKVTLRESAQVIVRSISVDDRKLERLFIEGMSPDARRFRFLETKDSPPSILLTQLTAIDSATDVAFVALFVGAEATTEIGAAHTHA